MFLKAEASPAQEKKSLIFSTAAIKSAPNPYTLGDGRVTGYNLLRHHTWLIRTSSTLGALTVDFHKDKMFSSIRFILTKDGWIQYDNRPDSEINCSYNTALQYSSQLFELISSINELEGLEQIVPTSELAAKEHIYSCYDSVPASIKPSNYQIR